ncbi:uncharacterized protein LOC131078849 [Cryptomeria japonica]|uniref:uncharacterized protein LOC131078849 n=1 Tax=Cryptomeria japonica TaxID=3369 RepID=UPI0025AB6810|nr:uncharacterized protein LOC131078849 [Cryptomeria japonica]
MARWIQMVEIGRMSSSYSSSVAAFLAVVVCVFAAATVAAALCVKEFKSRYKSRRRGGCLEPPPGCLGNWKLPVESRGRALINTLSNKSLLFSKKWRRSDKDEAEGYESAATEDGDFLWQKNILMGVRCQPLNFSGLIIYDHKGERLPQLPPRSPEFNVFVPSPQADKGGN